MTPSARFASSRWPRGGAAPSLVVGPADAAAAALHCGLVLSHSALVVVGEAGVGFPFASGVKVKGKLRKRFIATRSVGVNENSN